MGGSRSRATERPAPPTIPTPTARTHPIGPGARSTRAALGAWRPNGLYTAQRGGSRSRVTEQSVLTPSDLGAWCLNGCIRQWEGHASAQPKKRLLRVCGLTGGLRPVNTEHTEARRHGEWFGGWLTHRFNLHPSTRGGSRSRTTEQSAPTPSDPGARSTRAALGAWRLNGCIRQWEGRAPARPDSSPFPTPLYASVPSCLRALRVNRPEANRPVHMG